MSTKTHTLSLTGIIIQDRNDRGFTAYFAEFPEVIADGTTKEEATENLIDALKIMVETRKIENDADVTGDGLITKQKFDFELA